MKSTEFGPGNMSEEEIVKMKAKGIPTKVSDIDTADLVLDSENFNISVDASGEVKRKAKKEKIPTLDEVEQEKLKTQRVKKEKKTVDQEKLKAIKIALEKETEKIQKEAELLEGGAEYVIDSTGNKTLKLTDKQQDHIKASEMAEKQAKIDRANAERRGFKDVGSAKGLFRGAGDTVGSIFGTRVIWESKELYDNIKSKKGSKVAASDLLEVITLKNAEANIQPETSLTQSQIEKSRVIEEAKLVKGGATYSFNENGEKVLNMTKKQIDTAREDMNLEASDKKRTKDLLGKKIVKSALNPEENIEIGPVRDRIRAFNEKLKAVEMPAAEKQELRNQMATLLMEHRRDSNKLEAKKVEEVSRVFDVYASNSAKIMTVAKEAVNTVSIFAMMPWLRGIGYTAFSGAESFMKAGNDYDKKHFKDGEVNTKEKLAYIGKSLTIDAASETYNSLIGNFYKKNEKGKRMGFGKALLGAGLKTLSLGGAALRLLGVGRFEQQLAAGNKIMTEGGEKFVAALADGHVVDALRQGGENWVHNVQNFVSMFHSSSNPDKTFSDQVGGHEDKVAISGYTPRGGAGEKFIETEEIKKLATVGKGEGVLHAFTRQIEHSPKAFGYSGHLDDKVELHKWAQMHAYKAAINNQIIDPTGQVEVRVADSNVPQQFVLHPDLTMKIPSPDHLYAFDQHAESTRALANSEVLSSHAGSLTPDTSGNIPEFLRAQDTNNRIHDIYHHWYTSDSQGAAEWRVIQERQASDILAGKFGEHVGTQLDAAEISSRENLQGYLKELHDKTGLEINNNETVNSYIMRANDVHSLSMADYINNQNIAEHVRTQEVGSQVRSIFQHWFSSNKQGMEEWKVIKDTSAKDVLVGKFGKFVGTQLDASESSSRDGIQRFIKSLVEKTKLVIGDKETVEAFIMRANKIRSLKV